MWFSASHRLGNYGSTCLLKDFCYWTRAIVPLFYVSKELNRWKSLALSSKKRIFATENRVLTQKKRHKLCILNVKHT